MKRELPTKEQLRDGRILSWVLRQWDAADLLGDDERSAQLDSLFSEEVVRHWMDGGEKMTLASLLRVLPVSVFRAVSSELEERYFRLPREVAHAFLFRLAECEPVRALALLEEVLAHARGPRDTGELTFAVHVANIIGAPANELLRQIIEKCTGDSSGYHMFWSGLFKAMVRLDLKEGPQRIARGLIATDGPGFEGELIMHDLFAVLAPGCPFLDMLLDIEFRMSGYRFADVPELFRPNVAVEDLDRLAEAKGHTLLEEVLSLLPEVGPYAEVARFTHALAAALPHGAPAQVLRLTHLLAVAAYAAQYQCTSTAWEEMSYSDLVEVAAADISLLPHEEVLLAQVVARTGSPELRLLHDELDLARSYRGAERLVRAISALHRPESMSVLLCCLDIDTEEGAVDLAVVTLARYGEAVLAPLRARWPEMDEFSRARALEVVGLVGGPTAADHLLHFFADASQEELSLGAWCDAAEAVPDGRYLALLELPRHRSNAELQRTLRKVKALVA